RLSVITEDIVRHPRTVINAIETVIRRPRNRQRIRLVDGLSSGRRPSVLVLRRVIDRRRVTHEAFFGSERDLAVLDGPGTLTGNQDRMRVVYRLGVYLVRRIRDRIKIGMSGVRLSQINRKIIVERKVSISR